jgi:hypothetical protein
MGRRVRLPWLLAISGTRADVLARCESERVKFESLGWAILITSGMATVSMWFALTSAMGVPALAAVPVALFWGLVIMGIDRWLITTLPSEGRRRFSMAAPRLVLAILLGTLISTPLVLRVFQSEINAEISVMKADSASRFLQAEQRNQVGQQVTYWRGAVANLTKVIDSGGLTTIDPANDPQVQTLTKQRDQELALQTQYYNQWNCQLYGFAGCKKGNGQVAAAAHDNYLHAKGQVAQVQSQINQRERQLAANDASTKESRLAQAKAALPSAQQQLSLAVARQNALQASFDATNQSENGLLIRLQALDKLSGSSATVRLAQILLFLLFLVIECLPVTVKLLQQPGNYEKILQVVRDRELSEAKRGLRSQRRSAASAGSAPGRGSNTDEEVLRIWQERADERTRALREETSAEADRQAQPDDGQTTSNLRRPPVPELESSARARLTGEQPSLADRELRRIRDERVTANSDGHGRGIPLQWDDDND